MRLLNADKTTRRPMDAGWAEETHAAGRMRQLRADWGQCLRYHDGVIRGARISVINVVLHPSGSADERDSRW